MTHVAYFKQKLFPFSDVQLKDGGLAPERWAMKNTSGQRFIRAPLTKKKKVDVKMKKHRRKKDKPIEEKWQKTIQRSEAKGWNVAVLQCFCGCGRSPEHSYPEVIKHISDLCVAAHGMVTRWLVRKPIWWCSFSPLSQRIFLAIHGHSELEPSYCL